MSKGFSYIQGTGEFEDIPDTPARKPQQRDYEPTPLQKQSPPEPKKEIKPRRERFPGTSSNKPNPPPNKAPLSPAERAAQKGHPGIKTTPNGGPDFSGTGYLYPTKEGQRNIVPIKMTGDRKKDFKEANEAAGLSDFGNSPPPDYTWHHVDDYNPATGKCSMQLVKSNVHNDTKPHAGSCAQYDAIHGPTYNPAPKGRRKK